MNQNRFLILLAGMLLFLPEVHAQFTLSGEFRPRTEFSRGYKSLAVEDQKMSTATAQRTRLNAFFTTEAVKARLVLQDVRFWGSQPQLVTNEDYATSVHEAWAEIQLAENLFLKAGRQELMYDDSRIFGNVGWAHQARSHDLALFKIENDFKLHFGIAHHENADITNNFYNGPDAYKDLQFLWFNKTWEKTDKNYAFNPLYGTNHAFNGHMDYFYVGNHINSVGLNDVYLKYAYKKEKFGFTGHLHYFASAGKIRLMQKAIWEPNWIWAFRMLFSPMPCSVQAGR